MSCFNNNLLVVNSMHEFVDERTIEGIGFDYVLDRISVTTPYGQYKKDNMSPFMPGEEEELKEELNKIETIVKLIQEHRPSFVNLKTLFAHIKDLRKSINRASAGDALTVVELFEIKAFVFFLREIYMTISDIDWNVPDDMVITPIKELEKLFDPKDSGIKTFYIYDEYSDELKNIRMRKLELGKKIKIEKKKARDKVKEDLNLNIRPNGEVVIAKDEKELIKTIEDYPLLTYSSETYMNIKFNLKSTEVVNDLIRELDLLKEVEEEEEYKVRQMLSEDVASYKDIIYKNMEAIGTLDLNIAKAYMALDMGGVKPTISNEPIISFTQGRHIKLERHLMEKNREYIPIDMGLTKGVTCITGANMGGKSVTLKLIGLIISMVQYGLFVPCREIRCGLFEFIFISIGDFQDTDMGLSTFGGEIKEIQKALLRSDKKGIILIDELASGTNPQEGSAISKAIVNYLMNRNCIVVITTHYDNIANTEGVKHLQVIGLENVDYIDLERELEEQKEYGIDTIAKYMDYRLKEVKSKSQVPRDALNIARLMGLDEDIVESAEGILQE